MTSRMKTLTKQALERWSYVPASEQTTLLEKLQAATPGTTVIEIDPPEMMSNTSYQCKARIVSILFGMDISLGTKKRYLMLSDIPKGP